MSIYNFGRIEHITSLIDKYKNNKKMLFGLYIERGLAYIDIGAKANALEDFQKALEINDKSWELYYNFGILYLNFDEKEKAKEYFEKSLSLNPKAYINYFQLGNIYAWDKKYEIAIEYFTKVIKMNRKYYDAYNNRALCYKEKGKYEEALKDINRAINIKHRNPEFYYNRGNILLKMQQIDKAIDSFSTSIGLDYRNVDSYYARGIALTYKGQFKDAIKDLTNAINLIDFLDEEALYIHILPYYYTVRGAIFLAYWLKKEADMDFIKAEKLYGNINGNNREYIINHILNLLYLDKLDEADKLLKKCAEIGYTPPIWFIYNACLEWRKNKNLDTTLKFIEDGLKIGYKFDYFIKANLFEGYFLKEIIENDKFKEIYTKYSK